MTQEFRHRAPGFQPVISFGFRKPLLASSHRAFLGVVVALSDKAFLGRGQALGPAAKGAVPDGRSAR